MNDRCVYGRTDLDKDGCSFGMSGQAMIEQLVTRPLVRFAVAVADASEDSRDVLCALRPRLSF